MKMSFFYLIAIVCLLTIGFLSVTPFLPKVKADCNYCPASKCESAAVYAGLKLAEKIIICSKHGDDSDECEAAKRTAENAQQWAEWVCEHASSSS